MVGPGCRMDTIFAISTVQGKAGIAVVRVSGPRAFVACHALCGDCPPQRVASVRVLRDANGRRLDQALVLTFAKGHSFTGEDVVEFQTHGSTAVVQALLCALAGQPGLRQADPGEFTRRALENGMLDLAQVEGLADLIDAETEAQRRQALRVLSGELGKRAERWRADLIRAAALMEATIDFVDEDVPVDVVPEVSDLLGRVIDDLRREAEGAGIAERVRCGFEVAILGAPNVGKSTLLNALAGREAAITSEYAGTTRDVIEVRMDLRGLPVTLLDTAGLRETRDVVESMGIDRARSRAMLADLRVFLMEDGTTVDFDPQPGDIVVRAKADLAGKEVDGVSGLTGQGVTDLIRRIGDALTSRSAGVGVATRARHAEALQRGAQALERAVELLPLGESAADLVAEEVRAAVRALDSLVGRVDVENVLDEIFTSFCIGK